MQVDIPTDLVASLTKVCKKLKKGESSLVIDALRAYLEDIEDAEDAAAAFEQWQLEGGKTVSFEQVLKDVGLS